MENTYSLNAKKIKHKKDKYGADYDYSPLRKRVNTATLAGGLVIRAVLVAMLVLGMTMFVSDCFVLEVGFVRLFIYAVIWSAAFCAVFCGGKVTLVGLALTAVMLGAWVFITPGFANYIVNCVMCTMTTAGEVFVSKGYDNMEILKVGYQALDTAEAMNGSTCFMLTIVLSLIMAALNMRRVFIIPTFVLAIAMCVPGITYNFMTSNWGFALVVLALFSLSAVKMFERCYKAKKEDRQRRAAMSGYMGGTVALIALLCISIPALIIKGKWADIPGISKPINVARDVVTSVISGDMPNLQEMGLVKNMDEQNSRRITPETPDFTGKSMLSVSRTYSSSSGMYVRGWVASPNFDGTAWYSATNDVTDAYNNELSMASKSAGYGEVYSPDYMTEAFFDLLFAPGTLYDTEKGYTSYRNYGFAAYRTDISMVLGAGSGNLLYIPSTSLISGGLSKFGSTDEYSGKVKQFYDGIVLTNWLNMDKSYSVTTVSTNFSAKGSAEIFMKLVSYAEAVKQFISFDHSYPDTAEKYAVYEDIIYSYGGLDDITSYIDISEFYDRYMSMSASEKETFYQRYCVLADCYTQYAVSTYGYNSHYSNSYIKNFVNNIVFEPSDTQHEKVMKVVQYIVSNYSYSLTPKAGVVQGLTSFEQFIAETKEGYCTHLATLLTLALRELNIPARYVEGYLVDGFSDDGTGVYTVDVTDNMAHAWVEVYYPGYGWLNYEAARTFAKDLYGSDIKIPSNQGETTDWNDTAPGTTPSFPDDTQTPDDITPVEPSGDPNEPAKRVIPWGKIFRIIILFGVIFGGGFLLLRYMKRKADDAVYSRRKLLEEATYGADPDEYPSVSHQINTTLLGMMSIAGLSPERGELPTEYAKRIDDSSMYVTDRSFSEIMVLMQKQEFGQSLDNDDLRVISEYTDSFWKQLYQNLSGIKKIWYRYILRSL